MNIEKFKNQLNETGFIELIIKFKRPTIKKQFIEKYRFVKLKNGMIKSYLNGVKEFETTSLNHMYFIYRKPLNHKSGCMNIRKRINNKILEDQDV